MQDYFLSIGLCLFKGKDIGKPEKGWILTASVVYGDHDWLFSGKTLGDVDQWWKTKAAAVEAENRCLRLVLNSYRPAPTEDLEALANWAESIELGRRPDREVDDAFTEVARLLCGSWEWRHKLMRDRNAKPPPLPESIHAPHWRKKAAALHRKHYKGGFYPRRGLIHCRIARLARRSCLERIRNLPPALCEPQTRARL